MREGLPAASRSWQLLDDFITWAHAREITVVAGFPVTVARDTYAPEVVREIGDTITEFYRSRGVPVLGRPENGLLPKASFYDHPYHLTGDNAEAYTGILIDQLIPYLEPLLVTESADAPSYRANVCAEQATARLTTTMWTTQ